MKTFACFAASAARINLATGLDGVLSRIYQKYESNLHSKGAQWVKLYSKSGRGE